MEPAERVHDERRGRQLLLAGPASLEVIERATDSGSAGAPGGEIEEGCSMRPAGPAAEEADHGSTSTGRAPAPSVLS